MLKDLLDTGLALLVCPVIFVLPGYAIGRAANILEFERKNWVERIAISLALSVSLGPISIYLLLLVGSWAHWIVLGIVGVLAVWWMIHDRAMITGFSKPMLVACVIVFALVLISVDIGWGDRLYFSVAARDHVRTIALTHALATNTTPAPNPFFTPNEVLPLFYYYGWMQLTSLVDVLGGGLVGPRGTTFASTAFCGIALLGTLSLYLVTSRNPLLDDSTDARRKTRLLLGAVFLAVGGVDLLMFVGGALGLLLAGRPVVITDLEWWNEPVLMWIIGVATAPHHVAGLIAALTGFKLARTAVGLKGVPQLMHLLMAGVGFASTVFCSVWIGIAAALIAALWIVWNVLYRRWDEVRGWMIAGVTALIIALPYMMYLRANGSVEGAPVEFAVRIFGPVLRFFGLGREGIGSLVHLLFLPLNYTLEIGFLTFSSWFYWKAVRRKGRKLDQDARLEVLVFAVGLLLAGFAISAVRNNDLGFRVPMFAQFVAIIWAVNLVEAFRSGAIKLEPWKTKLLRVLFVVGVASSIASALVLRFSPLAADAGIISMPGMYSEDHHLGERTADLRASYEWLQAQTSEDAVIQHNPRPLVPRIEGGYEFAAALYSERHAVAYDSDMGTMYGVLHDEYDSIADDIYAAFTESDVETAGAVAARWNIDAYVVTDRDPVWNDSTSWVWTETPDFVRPRARVFLNPAETF